MGRFYSSQPEGALRLGDIVMGFPVATPRLESFEHAPDEAPRFDIAVSAPRYLVVMTPCCAIEDGSAILAPLANVRPAFFRNPYFKEDLTRLNRKVDPQQSIPPQAWMGLPADDKVRRLAAGPGYVFGECFVYEPHDLLPPYDLKQGGWKETARHYMVDFKTVYRLESRIFLRDAVFRGNKILQLTPEARRDLRDKLTYFFSRPAEEDLRELQLL